MSYITKILSTECPWCGEIYIKEKIGQQHGCPQEKKPEQHVIEAVEAASETITIFTKKPHIIDDYF